MERLVAVVRTNTMRNILMLCLDSTKMALVGVVVINYILVPKKQKLEAATTVSKYKKRKSGNAEHCSIHIFSFSLLQTCSIVFITFSSYIKHPNKSFLTQYIYLDIFLTSFLHTHSIITVFFYNSTFFFSFNVSKFKIYIFCRLLLVSFQYTRSSIVRSLPFLRSHYTHPCRSST